MSNDDPRGWFCEWNTASSKQGLSVRYELYYWPGIQGRGEFVRLALEEAGADYADVTRGERGMAAMGASPDWWVPPSIRRR